MAEEQLETILKSTSNGETRGVAGRVKSMKVKFDNGNSKGSTPLDAERARLESQNAKALAARYNMQLRGHLVASQKKKEGKAVAFEPHEFTAEWEEYPWHFAAAFGDDDEDAFWLPELAFALDAEDEDMINRAILTFFLQEYAPERLKEVDAMLSQNRGKEEELFLELQTEFAEQSLVPKATAMSVSTQGEEEKSPDPPSRARKHSFVVTGMKSDTGGWELNKADEDIKDRIANSGESSEKIEALMSVASSQPYAPGGVL